MKPIIGILGRKTTTADAVPFEGNIVVYDYMDALTEADVNYIGLISDRNYKDIDPRILDLCDGFIFPGGSEIKPYHYKVIEYALKNKTPFLGICLGSQAIGLYFKEEKVLRSVTELDSSKQINHLPEIKDKDDRSTLSHKVNIKTGTLLYQLFGEELETNGRHNFALEKIDYPLEVAAQTDDGIIEAVELVDKSHFMVGVQWHPENMESMKPLFDVFVNNTIRYSCNKNRQKTGQTM